jgi:hypothetical protein
MSIGLLGSFGPMLSALLISPISQICSLLPSLSLKTGHTLSDSSWVNAMHKELENFERN